MNICPRNEKERLTLSPKDKVTRSGISIAFMKFHFHISMITAIYYKALVNRM
ncbi:hypothetical protein [Brevibacillus reuszeri]|uniref:hypothetical protein n=1 Tax=Brevibacillus reuszeri TaxID=54915 RepID=UPI003D22FE0B